MSILQRKKDNVDLRNYYNVYLQVGLIITLLLFIGLFRANLDLGSDADFAVKEQETIKMEEVVQTEQINKPPPPPRPPVPIEVPNDQDIDDSDLNLDASLDLDNALDVPPPPKAKKVEEEEPEIFLVVEQDPELIGGLEGLQRSIKYPEIARKAGIEGRVFVQFVVDEKGNVVNPVVTRGIGGGCDEAALAAVKKARFKPGKQRGRPVKVQYSLPVTFKLQN